LAEVAKERGVRVQSHMCESWDQMRWVEETRGKGDEEVFDQVRRGYTGKCANQTLPSLEWC
jgi:cytosine/adenosine deaminase-related metal-dependent hydrolase